MRDDESWQVFVDKGWAKACADTGFSEESQCATVVCGRDFGNITVGQALGKLIVAAADNNVSYDLLRWIGLFMFDEVPTKQRSLVLYRLGEIDPPTAALIHEFRSDLDADEQQLLRSLFYPSMPTTRNKIEARTV